MKTLEKNIIVYNISIFLIILSRSLPHAIMTTLLFDKGLSLPNILIVQSFFSIAILLFEFPSGVLSDRYSRKFLYLLSNLIIIITFLIIYKFNGVYFLSLAWFIYGLAEATSSGTLDAQIINDIKNQNEGILKKFLKNSNQLSMIAMILGSVIGSFLYFKIGFKIYLLGVVSVLLSFFMILIFFKNEQEKFDKNTKLKLHLIQVLDELKKNEILRTFILLSIISQIYFQSHFQLWQALFLFKGIKKENLYIFYILFQMIGIISYNFPIEKLEKFNKFIFLFFNIIMIIPIFMLLDNKFLFIIIYLLYCSIFTILNYYITYNFSNKVSQKNISSLISLKGTVVRISSSLMLWIFGFILNYINVNNLVVINFMIVTSILLILTIKLRKKMGISQN